MIETGIRQDWDELLRSAGFSPRIGASWAPRGSKNTKLSAGFAVVRDATELDLFTRPQDQYAIDTYFTPFTGPLVNRFAITQSTFPFPLYRNWTVGWEQRLPQRITLNVTGLRKRGHDGLAYTPAAFPGVFDLSNSRRDSYDSAEILVRQTLRNEYQWMASYTRSRAHSNAVIDLDVDQPLGVLNNTGPLNWDTPNRFLTWAYLPTRWTNWAVAYSMEARTGFPYSVVNNDGEIVGGVNSERFPWFFSLNLHPEWKFIAFHRRWALRGGVNNLTNHLNPTVAETVPGQPVMFLGSEGRHFVFRIRWLGKAQD